MPCFPTLVPARRFRLVPPSALVLGAMLLGACQDNPVAPLAPRPALTASLSERGESRSERTPTFTTIDVPGAASTQAWGINARGDIVGSYVDVNKHTHGYLLRRGEFTTIDFPGSSFTEARGIGPRGEVVGSYRFPAEEGTLILHGFLRTKDGRFEAVNDPPHLSSVGQRILPDRTILGCRHETDQMTSMRGIVISRRSAITELDLFGSMENGGTPDHSRIVGLYYNMAQGNRPEGFLIDEGRFMALLVPGSAFTQAWDMNPEGEIVGVYSATNVPTGVFHGFVLKDERYTTLDFPGATSTRARGVNSRGNIVGTYMGANKINHGFLARVSLEEEGDE